MLEGIQLHAHARRWNVFVAEHEMDGPAIADLLAFWNPDGVIVEGAMDEQGLFSPDVFGTVPVVYLASDRTRLPSDALCVNHDSATFGLAAAREFLSQRQRSFAASGIVSRQSTRRLPRANADVSRALETIRRRACDGLKPRDVFAEAGRSRRLVELRFRELTGHSVQDEIRFVRLARVKELLSRPDVPLESVAARCGWKSTAQLRVLFRTAEGLSMRQWRRAKLQQTPQADEPGSPEPPVLR